MKFLNSWVAFKTKQNGLQALAFKETFLKLQKLSAIFIYIQLVNPYICNAYLQKSQNNKLKQKQSIEHSNQQEQVKKEFPSPKKSQWLLQYFKIMWIWLR